MSRFILLLVLVTFVATTPLAATAATYRVTTPAYNYMTVEEKIAFLYGMIAQLQLMLQAAEDREVDDDIGVARPRNNRSDIDVDTLAADDIENDRADIRARVDLNGEDEARVWFEYGEDSDDLDERTTRRRITDSGGDVKTITVTLYDLDEDERYYYRAVAEDEDGDREYGSIRSFETDSRRSSGGDFDLDLSDTNIEAGDEIDVDWEVPSSDEGSRNWIGLYEVGDDNDEYIKWSYIDYDDRGTETFRIDDEGEYEFRLFLNNSYDDEVTSQRVTVY